MSKKKESQQKKEIVQEGSRKLARRTGNAMPLNASFLNELELLRSYLESGKEPRQSVFQHRLKEI